MNGLKKNTIVMIESSIVLSSIFSINISFDHNERAVIRIYNVVVFLNDITIT